MRLSRTRSSVVLLVLSLAIAWVIVGCTSTVKPPRGVGDPAEIYLTYEARHRGLVLPDASGELIEYGYGDRDWYALGKDRWYHAFDTLLWPTGGTLGRHATGTRTGDELRAHFLGRRIVSLRVELVAVVALRDRLEAEFAAGIGDSIWNPDYRMDFVPYPHRFWCFHNCNDAVADWLRELGCEVSWVPVRTDLRVEGE